jgi:hypothetical protein
MRRDEAFRPDVLDAGAVGDDLAVGDEDAARSLAALIDLGFPAQLAGRRIERTPSGAAK